MHRCLSSLLALTLPLIATEALIAQGRRIPTAEELDSARTDVVRVMAEHMLRSVGGDISHGSSQVMAAAFEAEDREILIDGTPAGMVDAPLGVMM